MIYYKECILPNKKIAGKKKRYDQNIYTFDIETSSYFILNGIQHNAIDYDILDEKTRKEIKAQATMYIWMFGINENIYYGRTWEELEEFLKFISEGIPEKKFIYVHNLAFEFQFLYSNLQVSSVFARKSHKVIKCELERYNFEMRCTYFMSNTKLAKLSDVYNLPVEKLEGELDYNKIRHSITPLTKQELAYCENDCLVLYYYILTELKTYKQLQKIPVTSTGHVRKELHELIDKDYKYKYRVRKAVNTDPHIYNFLVNAFQGGYTHANYIYADEVLKNVDSYDEASAYPYVMVAYKYPSTKFKRCYIKTHKEMLKGFAYLLKVKFKNVKSKYYNHFISSSKCYDIRGAKYDNGRIMSADSFFMYLTDIDFYLYLDSYSFEYEIEEAYFSVYNYLPKQFINFILDKYIKKTEYKNVEEKELEYQLEKQKFNALYGMSVTNNIKDEVEFKDNSWNEVPIDNEEIIKRLKNEEKMGFLSFAYGVWVTAYARNNLLRNVMKLDKYTIYCDTDSIKLYQGYDKKVIEDYNKTVEERIKYVSNKLGIDLYRYAPSDIKGHSHMLGIFELEKEDYQLNSYKEFITQGAKKYAYKVDVKDKKTGEIKKDVIKITVAGVPKSGAKCMKDLKEFKDGLLFNYSKTGKNLLVYCDDQEEFELTDYLGFTYKVKDKSGCCLLPNSYTLGKALDYCHLISDDSSARAIYKEGV